MALCVVENENIIQANIDPHWHLANETLLVDKSKIFTLWKTVNQLSAIKFQFTGEELIKIFEYEDGF